MRAYLLGGRAIHFPFPTGLLTYQCEGCDAPCCKATPLGIGKSRELVLLEKAQPRIPLFTTPGFHGSPMLALQAPREKCWFLDDNTRCRLESRIGRTAKPTGCRLFPFQRIRSLGKALTLLPDFSCPLRVADEVSEKGPSSHDELVLELHRTHIPNKGHPQLPPPRDLAWHRAVKLEGRVVRRIARHLDDKSYLAFAEKQAHLTADLLDADAEASKLIALDHRIRTRLGLQSTAAPGPVRDLIALTGVLRLMTSSLPRQEMPGILLATAALLEAYEEMRGVKRTARTVVSLYEQRLPLIYVLSHLGTRLTLQTGSDPKRLLASFPAVRAPLVGVLDGLVANKTSRRVRPLDALLDEEGEVFEPPLSFDAVAMLYALGRILLASGERAL